MIPTCPRKPERPNKAQQGDSLPVGSSLAFWLPLRLNLTRKLVGFDPRATCARTLCEEMKEYESNEDFFTDFRKLVQRIENGGKRRAAEKLRDGVSCLNRLTDGWALLMEAIDATLSAHQAKLDTDEIRTLREMKSVVREVIIRR